MLSGLARVVAAESVDVVVVAGDVYDRAVPSADATGVLDRVVGRLLAAGAAVVMTPGNHDSARRLGTFSGLLSAAGLHVRASTRTLDEPVLLVRRSTATSRSTACRSSSRRSPGTSWASADAPQSRGGARRGHGPRPRRPLPPPRRPLGRARPCLRRGRRRQRERARHLRRRRRPRPRIGVRRRRLRRARPPAPAADAVARACVTAARRCRTPSARPGRRSSSGWSTSTPPAWPRCVPSRCRCPGRSRSSSGELAELLADPAHAAVRGPFRLRPPDRRDPPGRSDAPAAGPVPALRPPGVDRHRARSPTAAATRSGCAAAATSTSPASSSATSAASRPRAAERELLARALGAADRAEAAG